MQVQPGDKFPFTPTAWTRDRKEWGNGLSIPVVLPGRVVWVHPKGRFFLVEGQVDGQRIRECFSLYGGR